MTPVRQIVRFARDSEDKFSFLPSISAGLAPDAKLGTSFMQNQDQTDRQATAPIIADAEFPVHVREVMFDRVMRDA